MMKSKLFILPLAAVFLFPAACTQTVDDQLARNICDGASQCTYRCPDGTITDPKYPKCPINNRDLLPPQNDNIGIEGMIDKK